MKTIKKTPLLYTILIMAYLPFIYNCSGDNANEDITNSALTQSDKEALLFMLEEEKLARDTYMFLDNLWAINQFSNIKLSEQTHMDAVATLLSQYGINYNILPMGEFANQDLQNLYNKFIADGSVSIKNALQIGATIEDLDIVDLQTNISNTTNTNVISVFEKSQCGSRNHLKSFVFAIESSNDTYIPQFLSDEDYNNIINSSHEKCGLQ